MTVEEVFCAVTWDNVSANNATVARIEQLYPKVTLNRCWSDCAELLCEDIFKIYKIESVLADALTITKFIKSHGTVDRFQAKPDHCVTFF
jgi:hypothetical protein